MTELKSCPFCAETIRAEALKCRYCGSLVEPSALHGLAAPWMRPRDGRMIAGVCVGLAERFGISVTIIRLAFLVGFITSGGLVLLIYVALWIAMPSEASLLPPSEERPRPRLEAS